MSVNDGFARGVGNSCPWYGPSFVDETDAGGVPHPRASLHDLDEPLHALDLHLVRHLVGHRSRLGACPR